MTLTDKHLLVTRQSPTGGGKQRIYRVGQYGLSVVDDPMLHHYPFAQEIAVVQFLPASDDFDLVYDTPLTTDVEVFRTDREAQAFIDKALALFETWACETCASPDSLKPSHRGSPNCQSGSIASGGGVAHCTCDTCF